jgi:hypothetical protein
MLMLTCASMQLMTVSGCLSHDDTSTGLWDEVVKWDGCMGQRTGGHDGSSMPSCLMVLHWGSFYALQRPRHAIAGLSHGE